jgi:hypothetical protein
VGLALGATLRGLGLRGRLRGARGRGQRLLRRLRTGLGLA